MRELLRDGARRARRRLDGVSFEVRAGEIVGIAGVEGNGQTELIEALAGLGGPPARSSRRRSRWAATDVTALSARGAQGARHRPRPRGPPAARPAARLRPRRERHPGRATTGRRSPIGPGRVVARPRGDPPARAEDRRRTSTSARRTSTCRRASLSGGNQQKLILGREFELPPRLLLVAQPTRGVDIGAIEFIHRRLVALRDRGCAVLLVSSELEEVTALVRPAAGDAPGADRRRGGPGADATEEIGLLMTGGEAAGLTGSPETIDEILRELLFPLIAVVAAFLVGGVLIAAGRRQPAAHLRAADRQRAHLAGRHRLHALLATPLIFTGLAVAVAFRCGLLNIGAEGQLYVAAFATAWVGITFAGWPALAAGPRSAASTAIARRRGLGSDPGRAQGALRGARGDHHDHDELHRRRAGRATSRSTTTRRRATPILRDGADRRGGAHRAARAVRSRASRSASRSTSPSCWRSSPACWSTSSSGARAGATRSGPPERARRRRSTAASRPAGRSCWRWRSRAGSPAWWRSTRCLATATATTTASRPATASPASRWRCSGATIRWA